MKKRLWLVILFFLLVGCQSQIKTPVTILADRQNYTLNTVERDPSKLLSAAKLALGPNDCLLYLGSPIPLDAPLPNASSYILTIRRAVGLTILTPDGQKTVQTCADTVGQALAEAGYTLYAADCLDPPADTPITAPLAVTYRPAREFIVAVDNSQVRIRSAAASVGQALAETGIPLVGLDYSLPDESAALPLDGKIRLVRVSESVALTQKTIPFDTRTELSADLEIDQQALLQGGEPGLKITRIRSRSEDGVQVSQKSEAESIVRPPQGRILGIGTKIVIRTTTVDGQTIEYWRVLNLFASNYSPCQSAGENGKCYYGTSSGLPVHQGVVGMDYQWYLILAFDRIYIPGYGSAVIGDSGKPPFRQWVDQGWTDEEYQANPNKVTGWTKVYFLTPVPDNPGYILPP